MQIWYDPGTLKVKARYHDRYTGTAWQDMGCAVYEEQINQEPSKAFQPGAIISFDGDIPKVVTPPPPPPPPPRTRLDDLEDKIINDTISFEELREYIKLRDRL